MNYIAFIVLNGIIIMRPSEIFEVILGAPLYNIAIVTCVALSIPQLLSQFAPETLRTRPISVLMLATLPIVAFSHIVHAELDLVVPCVDEYARLILYYFLLTATVTSTQRLRGLMFWITIFLATLAITTLLNLYGVVDIPALQAMDEGNYDNETGVKSVVIRLQASGIFNNPNAYSRILTIGVLLACLWMTDPKMRLISPLWLGAAILFGFTQIQTKSRGGFIGLMVGFAVLFISRYGLKRGIPLAVIGVPLLLVVAGGRQTELSADVGTGAHRISLWDAGLDELVDSKLLGIGMNKYAEAAHGYVAHNSFVHAYVELGLIGGIFYTGMFYYLISTLWSLRKYETQIDDPELRRLRPYMLAIIGAEAVGMLSISRCYITMTYTLLGLGATYIDLARKYPGVEAPRVDGKWMKRLVQVGVGFFVLIYIYVKYKMRNQ